MVQYQELEKAISERLEFQRLIEGVAAETSRHSERHMGSLSPSKLAGVLRHVPPGGSDESTLSFNSSSARRAAHGGEGGTLRVTSEIEELRATQAARAALASRRSEARCDTADRFADQEATIEGRLPNPDLPTTDAQLFSELGYLRKERDLVLKEKRVLQQLLSQASEEIRVLIGAEQRHVEELRSWVRQVCGRAWSVVPVPPFTLLLLSKMLKHTQRAMISKDSQHWKWCTHVPPRLCRHIIHLLERQLTSHINPPASATTCSRTSHNTSTWALCAKACVHA